MAATANYTCVVIAHSIYLLSACIRETSVLKFGMNDVSVDQNSSVRCWSVKFMHCFDFIAFSIGSSGTHQYISTNALGNILLVRSPWGYITSGT